MKKWKAGRDPGGVRSVAAEAQDNVDGIAVHDVGLSDGVILSK